MDPGTEKVVACNYSLCSMQLQPVQHVLDLQVNLWLLKMVPNDSPYPKTWG